MKTITVNATFKRIVEQKKVEKELKYYCLEKRKMYSFVGGSLDYDYVYDEELKKNIVVPKVREMQYQESYLGSNIEDIKKWAKNNLNYSYADIVSINTDSVIFEVPDGEVVDFVYELDRKSFEYTVE